MPTTVRPLILDAERSAATSVIRLRVDPHAEVGGQYLLEVADRSGNRSQSSGRFSPGQQAVVATISVKADARARLMVKLDDGRFYELDWPAAP